VSRVMACVLNESSTLRMVLKVGGKFLLKLNIRWDLHTHLRANTRRLVSTLDIIPTLRDLLGYASPYYARVQMKTCVTGRSLLSSAVPKDRVVVGWGGAPLDSISVGFFMLSNVALLYYPLVDRSGTGPELEHNDTSITKPKDYKDRWLATRTKSRVIRFVRYESNPFYGLDENPFSSLSTEDRTKWRDVLKESGWLDHPMTRIAMPKLAEFVNGGKPLFGWRWPSFW